LSGAISFLLTNGEINSFYEGFTGANPNPFFSLYLWSFPFLFIVILIAAILGFAIPPVRKRLLWRLPGFQETNLSHLASTIRVLLAGGCDLGESLLFVSQLENRSPAAKQLDDWHKQIAAGHKKIEKLSSKQKAIPPLFRWLVGNSGEDVADGFRQAGELYSNRAKYQIDMLLQAALPVSILALGFFIVSQFAPVMVMLMRVMESI
jgi:type II secretory pathway component PulF